MQALYQGNQPVGEVASDGAVYAVAGGRRHQVGSVADDGTVTMQGMDVGLIDESGNIFDGSGAILGSVDRWGRVFRYGKPFGSVRGDNPQRGGAALLLLFDASTQPVYCQPLTPSRPVHWVFPVIGLGLTLIVFLVVFAFFVVAAIVWLLWLLLTTL